MGTLSCAVDTKGLVFHRDLSATALLHLRDRRWGLNLLSMEAAS